MRGFNNMSLEEIKKIISQYRLTGDQSKEKVSLDEIKELLKRERGFSQRQADWAIELYINDMEEKILTDRNRDIEHDPDYPNYELITLSKNYDRAFARLCARDCIMIWFDKNVRIFLKDGLVAKNLEEEQIDKVLFDICGFTQDQFKNDEDQIPDISTNLPLWMPANNDYDGGWKNGIKEGHKGIVKQFRKPIEEYLVNYLSEKQVQEISDSAFNLKKYDNLD